MDRYCCGCGFGVSGLTAGFTKFMEFLPTLIGALVVLAIGWFVSSLVARLIERLLVMAKLERVSESSGVAGYLPKEQTLSHIVGEIAKWFIRLVFIQAAANLLGMPQVTTIINSVILFIPKLIVALAIIVIGSMIARFVGGLARGTLAEMEVGAAGLFAKLTQYLIIGFAIVAAFNQIGVAQTVSTGPSHAVRSVIG